MFLQIILNYQKAAAWIIQNYDNPEGICVQFGNVFFLVTETHYYFCVT